MGNQLPPDFKPSSLDMPANLSITLSNIPDGASILQITEFCKRTGVLATHPETGEDLILYNPKLHHATVTYFYPEGANRAIDLLNGEVFSFDEKAVEHRVKVERAAHEPFDFSIWKTAMRQQRKVHSYMGNHSEDLKKKEEKRLKIMILKHVFTTEEMIKKPDLYSQIIKDWTELCSQFGKVTLVKPMEYNPEGVVIVRFDTIQAAAKATGELDDAEYHGKTITAEPWDGSDLKGDKESIDNEQERIAKFERFLDGKDEFSDNEEQTSKDGNENESNTKKEK